jgi:nitrite reductase [NAD(P)H] small subunit
MSWIRITIAENIPLREGRAVEIGDREIALFNLGDRFVAVDNRCPHKGGPLADGIVAGGTVICPLHNWKICLESGGVEKPPNEACGVGTYATRVEDGLIWVDVPEAREVAA